MKKLYYHLHNTLNDFEYKFYPIDSDVYKHITDFDVDWYKSIYYYTEEQKEEAETIIPVEKRGKKYNRMRGVGNITDCENGTKHKTITDVVTNLLVWDFDAENVENARKDTVELIKRLQKLKIDESSIQVSFSGGKGFSVIVETDTMLNPKELKTICVHLADGLSTIDKKIYNPSRVFRVPLTKHHSGNYKTPFPIETIINFNSDSIIESSKQRLEVNDINGIYSIIQFPQELHDIKDIVEELTVEHIEIEINPEIRNLDWSKRLKFLSPAKYVLHNGLGFGAGQRHDTFMILASSYKNAGFSRGDAYKLLRSVDEKHCNIHKRESFSKEELWDNILETVYSDDWRGGTYASDHPIIQEIEKQLPPYLLNNDRKLLVNNDSVFDRFTKFATDIEKNTLKLGIKDFDNKITLLAGTSVGILGVPGSGKTTLAMNLLAHNSLAGEPSLFYSLDMNESLIALKQIQRVTGYSNKKIFDLVKNHPEEFIKIRQKAIKDYENVIYSFRFGITPADIREDIKSYEQDSGRKIRLVVVDYLENVQSGYSDPTVGSGMVAQQLANIAADQEVLMVILMQTQKSVNPGEPIESMRSIKGASVIEQSISVGLGIHREAQCIRYKDYDNFMTANVIKNRFGGLDTVTMKWEGAKSMISDMTKDDNLALADLLDLKKDDSETEQKEKNGRWGTKTN